MTSAEMLNKVRALLDESSEGFYKDANIYMSLSGGQNEIFQILLQAFRQTGNIHTLLNPFVKKTEQANSQPALRIFSLPDECAELISFRYKNAASVFRSCYKRELSRIMNFENDNSLCSSDDYYFLTGKTINLKSADNVSATEMIYICFPQALSVSSNSLFAAVVHDAIVQYAYADLLRNDEKYEASEKAYAEFSSMLTNLAGQ